MEEYIYCIIIILVLMWYISKCFSFIGKIIKSLFLKIFKIKESIEENINEEDISEEYNEYELREKSEELYLTPVQAGVLLENSVKFHHVVATVLHFLEAGFISLKKIQKNDGTIAYRFEKKEKEFCDYYLYLPKKITPELIDKLKENKVSISEIYIIDKIVFKYYYSVNADRIYQFYDNYDDYSSLYRSSYENDEYAELSYELRKVTKIVHDEFKKLQLYKTKINLHKNKDIKTKLGQAKINQLNLYKEKIEKDTLLPERSIENIYLWGEHLIYGVAFNVCKTSIKDANDIYHGRERKTNE